MSEKNRAIPKRAPFDIGTFLLIAGAAVNIPRWMGVFIPDNSAIGQWMHQVLLPVLDAIAGALMGIVAAGAVMYVFHSLGNTQRVTERTRTGKDGKEKKTIKHNERWYITAILGVGILLVSVYILEPYAKSVMPEFVRSNVGDATVWSYLAVLASEMIIAAVAMTDKNAAGFAPNKIEQPIAEVKAIASEEKPDKTAQVAAAVAHPFACSHCERSFATQNALNAHERSHKAKVVGYVATFEPVTKEGERK
jgi:hypothetical protein